MLKYEMQNNGGEGERYVLKCGCFGGGWGMSDDWGMSDALGEVSWFGLKIVSISVIRNSG